MSATQAASALERMYEDTSVRDELKDADATILLQWGEAQVNKLAQKELDDAAFEEAYAKLAKLMGRINRFVGKRHEADEAKLADLMTRFVDVATEAGYPIPSEKLAAFNVTQGTMDDATAVRAMTMLIEGESVAPAALISPAGGATPPSITSLETPQSPVDSSAIPQSPVDSNETPPIPTDSGATPQLQSPPPDVQQTNAEKPDAPQNADAGHDTKTDAPQNADADHEQPSSPFKAIVDWIKSEGKE